jgi:hypothetical protein
VLFARQKAEKLGHAASTLEIYHKISGKKSKFCEKWEKDSCFVKKSVQTKKGVDCS